MNIDKKNNDYVFASSRVRSMERYQLTKDDAEMMSESRTPEDALKILYDLKYGEEEDTLDLRNFEDILSKELQKAFSFIIDIAPDKEEIYPLLYPYDYHNLKVLLKAEFLGSQFPEYLIDIGTISPENLEEYVRERDFVQTSDLMKNAVLESIDVFARTQDPQVIDVILDKACFKEMLEKAKLTDNEFLIGYVKLLIDITNLKTFVRVREMGKPWDFFNSIFVEGGKIQDKLFISGYDEAYESFGEKMIPYGLSKAMIEGGLALKETGRFTVLERLCDNALMDYVKDAKFVSFGLEPLLSYLIAKEIEIRTVRIIMTGLLQNLPKESITERVRDTYV